MRKLTSRIVWMFAKLFQTVSVFFGDIALKSNDLGWKLYNSNSKKTGELTDIWGSNLKRGGVGISSIATADDRLTEEEIAAAESVDAGQILFDEDGKIKVVEFPKTEEAVVGANTFKRVDQE